MQIDSHAHAISPGMMQYKGSLLSHRGAHGRGGVRVSDEQIKAAANAIEIGPDSHLAAMERVGTDVQLMSPRPFSQMHSEEPKKLVHWYIEEYNTLIDRVCKIYPGKFYGVAGLPQTPDAPIEETLPELERCVKELGFRGCLINPDPHENSGRTAPPMGDRYWYPLYEKLCELDVVGHIHSAGSRNPAREPYTLHFINEETIAVAGLVNSSVFDDFPDLKILVSHGGGAIPYQMGRFDAASIRAAEVRKLDPKVHRFREKVKKLYFDTVLYTPEALELLIKVVGPERCLYGAECPGVGSVIDPETGRTFDHNGPHISDFEWLTDDQKKMIFEDNAKNLFKLDI